MRFQAYTKLLDDFPTGARDRKLDLERMQLQIQIAIDREAGCWAIDRSIASSSSSSSLQFEACFTTGHEPAVQAGVPILRGPGDGGVEGHLTTSGSATSSSRSGGPQFRQLRPRGDGEAKQDEATQTSSISASAAAGASSATSGDSASATTGFAPRRATEADERAGNTGAGQAELSALERAAQPAAAAAAAAGLRAETRAGRDRRRHR